jgi:hypothetical protein
MAERALVAIRGYRRRRPSLGGPSSANCTESRRPNRGAACVMRLRSRAHRISQLSHTPAGRKFSLMDEKVALRRSDREGEGVQAYEPLAHGALSAAGSRTEHFVNLQSRQGCAARVSVSRAKVSCAQPWSAGPIWFSLIPTCPVPGRKQRAA